MNDPAPTERPDPMRHGGRWLRWCVWGWLLFVLLSASGCAWLDARERQLIYRPTPGGAQVQGWRAGDERYFVDLPPAAAQTGEATGAMTQRVEMWWLPNADPGAPTLLYFHGTVNNLAQNLPKMEALRAAGFAVLAVDYRGWGLSTPMTPSERSILQDADLAWAELQRREPRAGRRVIYGHSMGSGVAVDLASRLRAPSDYAALILESAFTSFDGVAQDAGWWGGLLARFNHEHFASLDKIRQVHAPLLMLHGSADDTIPLRLGQQLYAAAHQPKAWVPIDGGGHADLQQIAPAQYQRALRSFREQYVASPFRPVAIHGSEPPPPQRVLVGQVDTDRPGAGSASQGRHHQQHHGARAQEAGDHQCHGQTQHCGWRRRAGSRREPPDQGFSDFRVSDLLKPGHRRADGFIPSSRFFLGEHFH